MKIKCIMVCVIFSLCALLGTAVAADNKPYAESLCAGCHKDAGAILPKAHPAVDKTLSCMSCHRPDPKNKEMTKFAKSIHEIHQGKKTEVDCLQCHLNR